MDGQYGQQHVKGCGPELGSAETNLFSKVGWVFAIWRVRSGLRLRSGHRAGDVLSSQAGKELLA